MGYFLIGSFVEITFSEKERLHAVVSKISKKQVNGVDLQVFHCVNLITNTTFTVQEVKYDSYVTGVTKRVCQIEATQCPPYYFKSIAKKFIDAITNKCSFEYEMDSFNFHFHVSGDYIGCVTVYDFYSFAKIQKLVALLLKAATATSDEGIKKCYNEVMQNVV